VSAGRIPYGALYFMLILIGATTNAMTAIAFPLMREYFAPAIAGTAVGCANTFNFLSSGAYQSITSEVIKGYKVESDGEVAVYSAKGYADALWAVCTVSFIAGAVASALTKDSVFADAKEISPVEEEQAPEPVEEETKRIDAL
jgi:hypothetical protein